MAGLCGGGAAVNVITTKDAGGVTVIAAEETPKVLQVLSSKPKGKP